MIMKKTASKFGSGLIIFQFRSIDKILLIIQMLGNRNSRKLNNRLSFDIFIKYRSLVIIKKKRKSGSDNHQICIIKYHSFNFHSNKMKVVTGI